MVRKKIISPSSKNSFLLAKLILYVFPWESGDEQNTDQESLAGAASGASLRATFLPQPPVFQTEERVFSISFFSRLEQWLPTPCSSSSIQLSRLSLPKTCLCSPRKLCSVPLSGWLSFWAPTRNPTRPQHWLWSCKERPTGPTDTPGRAAASTPSSTVPPWVIS